MRPDSNLLRPQTPIFHDLLRRQLVKIYPDCRAEISATERGVDFQLFDSEGRARSNPVSLDSTNRDSLERDSLRWAIFHAGEPEGGFAREKLPQLTPRPYPFLAVLVFCLATAGANPQRLRDVGAALFRLTRARPELVTRYCDAFEQRRAAGIEAVLVAAKAHLLEHDRLDLGGIEIDIGAERMVYGAHSVPLFVADEVS